MAKLPKDSIYFISPKLIADHFDMTYNTIQRCRSDYLKGYKTIWHLYCKAYRYDKACEMMDGDLSYDDRVLKNKPPSKPKKEVGK